MKLNLNVAPITFKGNTKAEVLYKMVDSLNVSINHVEDMTYYTTSFDDVVLVNIHKINRKVSQEKIPCGVKTYQDKQVSYKKSTIVNKAHWVLQAYIIPGTLMEGFGIEVTQQENHFDVKSI